MPWVQVVPLILTADLLGRHADARRVIARTEDQGFGPGAGAGDAVDVYEAGRRLDQDLQADPADFQPAAHLHLREQLTGNVHILSTPDLGDDNEVDALALRFHDIDQI